jgi:phosphomannomutase
MTTLTCFKAYDIRGRLGVDLDDDIAYRIGRGFARALEARRVVLGRDCRASSEDLVRAVAQALVAEGVEVLHLGLCGTEEMYFATSHFGADGGICVTASHNPMDWNGMKMVRAGSAPLDAATGLARIRALAEEDRFGPAKPGGSVQDVAEPARAAYVAQVLSFVDLDSLQPLRILVNAGNGAAGPTFDVIAAELAKREVPLEFERLHHVPDGQFPNGIPNPLLPENRPATADAVRKAGADFGVAWDGDFDRCFFFDHTGAFIDGEYVVGLLAGRAVQSRTGHAFIKQAMRDEGAVYGGEMSAHHYFRDFAYCDSGMIPWLLVAELVSRHGPLADLVAHRRAAFPSSGEINFTLDDPTAATARVRDAFAPIAQSIDEMDGVGFDLGNWRLNLRSSNTEPVVRLNVEARGDTALVSENVARLKTLLNGR